MGVLVSGLLLGPVSIGIPLVQKVMAQEDEGPVKQVLLVANEHPLKIAPENILHPGGIEYAAMTFNGIVRSSAGRLHKNRTHLKHNA